MYHPTTRVLTALELLQAHGSMTGAELARRLEVNIRTARHYIERLQDLGIPVEAERGRYGAYRLRPGYKLPPSSSRKRKPSRSPWASSSLATLI